MINRTDPTSALANASVVVLVVRLVVGAIAPTRA